MSLLSTLGKALSSKKGQAVLTFGLSWVWRKVSTRWGGADEARLEAARQLGWLEALAATTDTKVDDVVVAVLRATQDKLGRPLKAADKRAIGEMLDKVGGE